jgi:DNA/RNA endonuclease YhcR with UshA esterase domain
MRTQKEEKIIVVLLLMALGSLAVAFWAFGPEEGSSTNPSSSSRAVGAGYSSTDQTLQGQVLEMKTTKSGGNLILRLDSTALPIFIPSSAGAEEIRKKIQPGDKIQVKGSISDFQGEKELKVSHAADIQAA